MSATGSLSERDAATLVAATWHLTAVRCARLDTERDDSFHVVAAEGEFLFKLAHPDDEASVIDLQSAALAHADATAGWRRPCRALSSKEGYA